MNHAPHPTSDEYALCGCYITRDDPQALTVKSVDCLSCLMHLEAETEWHGDKN